MGRRAIDPDDLGSELGAALRRARMEREMSQETLAALLGCSSGYISNIETGKQLPSLRVIRHCEQVLGITNQALQRLVLTNEVDATPYESDPEPAATTEEYALLDQPRIVRSLRRNRFSDHWALVDDFIDHALRASLARHPNLQSRRFDIAQAAKIAARLQIHELAQFKLLRSWLLGFVATHVQLAMQHAEESAIEAPTARDDQVSRGRGARRQSEPERGGHSVEITEKFEEAAISTVLSHQFLELTVKLLRNMNSHDIATTLNISKSEARQLAKRLAAGFHEFNEATEFDPEEILEMEP